MAKETIDAIRKQELEAEQMIADARKQAEEIEREAHAAGEEMARALADREEKALAEAEENAKAEAEEIMRKAMAATDTELAGIESKAGENFSKAVDMILQALSEE